MKKHDLERALEQHVADAHLSEEAVRNIRKAVSGPGSSAQRKMKAGLALTLTLLLLSATALAVGGGFLEWIGRIKGTDDGPLPEGEALFEPSHIICEDAYVTYTLAATAYDGHAIGMVVEIAPREEDTLILGSACVAAQCYRYGSKPCVPEMGAGLGGKLDPQESFSLIRSYAAENGYRRVVLVDACPGEINGVSAHAWSHYSEWQGNRITQFLSLPVDGEQPQTVLAGSMTFESTLYDDGTSPTALHIPAESMTVPLTLPAVEPLWTETVSVSPALPIPGYGLSIGHVRLIGTPLATYANVTCAITDGGSAAGVSMIVVDAQGKFAGHGLIETTTSQATAETQSHTFRLSFPARADAPETLRVQVYSPGDPEREPQTVDVILR